MAIFSGSGDDQILNCVRAAVEGYRCSYSAAWTPTTSTDLSKQLKADTGKGSCVVNAARAVGVNKDNAYLEVACADGNPGWVIAYPRGMAKPNDVMSCAAAKVSGVGSCDLAQQQEGHHRLTPDISPERDGG